MFKVRIAELFGDYNFGLIDDLDYTYENDNTSRLLHVMDDAPEAAQPNGFRHAASSYDYDHNGNLVADSAKVLGIVYNLLNLPQHITAPTGSMLLDYSFGGEKIKKTVWAENPYTKYYLSGAEFKDGDWEAYYHGDGRMLFDDSGNGNNAQRWQYNITDHLGNVVVQFEDMDKHISDHNNFKEGNVKGAEKINNSKSGAHCSSKT